MIWIKERSPRQWDFSWQGGYGAFSVDSSDVDVVRRYIEEQEEHHRKVTFEDAFRRLLIESGVEWDARYLWE